MKRFSQPSTSLSRSGFSPRGSSFEARAFASRRRLDTAPERMSDLYVAEATPSVTGGRADQRIAMKASQVEAFARAIAAIGVCAIV